MKAYLLNGRFYTRGCIICLNELGQTFIWMNYLPLLVHRSRRTMEDSSSRCHNQTNNECLPEFVQTDNESRSSACLYILEMHYWTNSAIHFNIPSHSSNSVRQPTLLWRAAVWRGVNPRGSGLLAPPCTPACRRDLSNSRWSNIAAWCNRSPRNVNTGAAIALREPWRKNTIPIIYFDSNLNLL